MGQSRIRQFLFMLPFFILGIVIPVMFFGLTGDGPPEAASAYPAYPPGDDAGSRGLDDGQARSWRSPVAPLVAGFRSFFEGLVDRFVSPALSPVTIKLGATLMIFGFAFVALRVLLALVRGGVGPDLGFLVHKAAAPMFMGFLAVGSTWGIHQTVAEVFGVNWAAATVTLTAAIAALFALAGVKIR